MKLKTMPFDPANYLLTPADEAEYLTAYIEEDEGDGKTVAAALGVLARKHGMADMASAAQVNPNTLYRSLSENGNPGIVTVLRVLRAMGLTLTAKTAATLPGSSAAE